MANICSFSMMVKGKPNDIENFYKALSQDGNVWMGRGSEAEICYDDEENTAQIDGWCKWSIYSALVNNAISMREEPHIWSFGDAKADDLEFVTLWEACKKWNLNMEVYSEESGCAFQEHYVCIKGDVICDECVEWNEYYIGEYETKKEAEKELEIKISDEEWENEEYISRGGFTNWDFEI